MTIKTFYRMTLALPIIIPLIIHQISSASISKLLYTSLLFSGYDYIIFAIVMFFLIGQSKSASKIRSLFWLSPLIFILFAICGSYIRLFLDRLTHPNLVVSFDIAFIVIAFGFIIGYGYCLFIELIYRLFQPLGWIRLDQQNQ